MKIIISPAKSLDFESKAPTSLFTQPQFLSQSKKLHKKLKSLSKNKIGDLMKISDALADLNYERNQVWETPFTPENAKQAIKPIMPIRIKVAFTLVAASSIAPSFLAYS